MQLMDYDRNEEEIIKLRKQARKLKKNIGT